MIDRLLALAIGIEREATIIGLQQQRGAWRFSESVRVDNLGDRSYVGTVIVNESNARYFEPGPGRTAYLMVTASH